MERALALRTRARGLALQSRQPAIRPIAVGRSPSPACRLSMKLDPGYDRAYSQLGAVQVVSGRVQDARASLRKSLGAEARSRDGILAAAAAALHAGPGKRRNCSKRHRGWADRHARRLTRITDHRPRSPRTGPAHQCRLCVCGFCAVIRWRIFSSQCWAAHDRSAFNVFCYSGVERGDAVTSRLRGMAEKLARHRGAVRADVADRIHADGIDILVRPGRPYRRREAAAFCA